MASVRRTSAAASRAPTTHRAGLWLSLCASVFTQTGSDAAPAALSESLSKRDRELVRRFDEAALRVGGEVVRPLAENSDRVHLGLAYAPTGGASVTLVAPAAWGESNVASCAASVADGLGWGVAEGPKVTWMSRRSIAAMVWAEKASRRSGLQLHARVDWPGCFRALREAGVERVEVRLRAKFGDRLEVSPCGLKWKRGVHLHAPFLVAVAPRAAAIQPMEASFGFAPGAARRAWAMLACTLVVPLALLAGLRTLVLARVGDAAAYRAYCGLQYVLAFAAAGGWLVAFSQLGITDLLVLPVAGATRAGRTVVSYLTMVGPPTIALAGVFALSSRVHQRFREALVRSSPQAESGVGPGRPVGDAIAGDGPTFTDPKTNEEIESTSLALWGCDLAAMSPLLLVCFVVGWCLAGPAFAALVTLVGGLINAAYVWSWGPGRAGKRPDDVRRHVHDAIARWQHKRRKQRNGGAAGT